MEPDDQHDTPPEQETDTAGHSTDAARMLQRAEGANEPLHDDRPNLSPGEAGGRQRDPGADEERRALLDQVREGDDRRSPTTD